MYLCAISFFFFGSPLYVVESRRLEIEPFVRWFDAYSDQTKK
jgi:hypothetical protein